MKKILASTLPLVIALSLIGCTQPNEAEEDTYISASDMERLVNNGGWYTSINETPDGFSIMNDEQFYNLEENTSYNIGSTENNTRYAYYPSNSGPCSRTIDRTNGNTLIVKGTNANSFYLHAITDQGYTINCHAREDTLYLADDTKKEIAYINENEFNFVYGENTLVNVLELSGYGYKELMSRITGNKDSSITFGWFEGTTLKTEEFSFIFPFYEFERIINGDNQITAPVQTTTEGYFIVDISSIPAGKYMIENPDFTDCFTYVEIV